MAENFLSVDERRQKSVTKLIDSEILRKAQENHAKLIPIIETIIFRGRQEIALKGSDEVGPVLHNNVNVNDGNFRALLRFRVLSGDIIFENHLNSSAGNALYTSPAIQNSIIHICGELMQEQLVKKINSACSFSLLADETTDMLKSGHKSGHQIRPGPDLKKKPDFGRSRGQTSVYP
ncbi:hypothetical protein HELRODRAFT_164121 [Helobdella robusta]|uniref:Uncharacterized protein n=1 Tax=Helobdella robusta TaxID=6412 RepID=T1EUY5_HELRO|nr:hypothetical protein HELRODRAFT_164121 [Helobdella robusta]ESN94304.1 hypothetical protein HELRODRAFT_164121 [Helobdella robusta]